MVLGKESKTLLKKYVNRGVLQKSDVYPLWCSENWDCSNVSEYLKDLLCFDREEVVKNFCWYIWNNLWTDQENILNDDEIFFLKELISNNGVLKRQDILDDISSRYKIWRITSDLKNMNYIDLVEVNHNVLYVLSFELFQDFKNSRCGQGLFENDSEGVEV